MKTTNTVRMWKQLEDNIYEVSEDGQVRNTKTGRILNQSYNNKYYQRYGLSIGLFMDFSI